jgi:hypothetical protein
VEGEGWEEDGRVGGGRERSLKEGEQGRALVQRNPSQSQRRPGAPLYSPRLAGLDRAVQVSAGIARSFVCASVLVGVWEGDWCEGEVPPNP